MRCRLAACVSLVLLGCAVTIGIAAAQPRDAARRLATIDGIRQFPTYFHLQNVLLRGELVESDQRIVLRTEEQEMRVILDGVSTVTGPAEVRAQVIDVGRMEQADPRLGGIDLQRFADRWPQPGEEVLLRVTDVTNADPAVTATPRALALEPWKFEGQTVTLSGQFRGRNLFGDLPGSPARSQYDFVLRAGDGAIWVTGLRPRGRGFNLDVDARVDTSQWVQVTGVVRRVRAMVAIEAKTIAAAQAPAAPAAVADEGTQVAAPPGEVVFSAPTADENSVDISSPIRIQFSRGVDASTIQANIRVAYMGAHANLPAPEFETNYDVGNRALTVRFKTPPERFSTMTIETLPGLKTFDGAGVTPWKVTFSFGG